VPTGLTLRANLGTIFFQGISILIVSKCYLNGCFGSDLCNHVFFAYIFVRTIFAKVFDKNDIIIWKLEKLLEIFADTLSVVMDKEM
ncbi:hypothetical protein ACJX0J_039242, partial [Zea mays]